MGEYEDLLEKAQGGDESAFEELQKFSGSNLRDQAEAAQVSLKENEPFIRKGKFDSLTQEHEIEGLTLADLEGVDTTDLSADLLRERAEAKQASIDAIIQDAAKKAGFESVEEYNKAVETVKEQQAKQTSKAEVIGGAVASTSGGTPVPAEVKEPYEQALDTFKEATKQGATHDVAIGEAAHTLMAAQAPVELPD